MADDDKTYIEVVKKKYDEEKGGEMSPYLSTPTPGMIKAACKFLAKKPLSNDDQRTITKFLALHGAKGFHKIDNDKLKPVWNFLLGNTKKPNFLIVELAAWLIDFEPRPETNYINRKREEQLTPEVVSKLPPRPKETLKGIEQVNQMREELKNEGAKKFLDATTDKDMKALLDKWGEERLRPMLLEVMDQKFFEMERRLQKMIWMNKKFGGLGLLFITAPNLYRLKEDIIEMANTELESVYEASNDEIDPNETDVETDTDSVG